MARLAAVCRSSCGWRSGTPVHLLQCHDGTRVRPRDHVIEHATTPDSVELVAVTNECDPCTGLVGDGQERSGGVLVEHSGLVDEEEVPGPEIGRSPGLRVWFAGPVPISVPTPAVLVDQPSGGVACGAGLGGGDLGCLQRGRDHHQPTLLPSQHLLGGAQGRRLSGPGGAFDHDQCSATGQDADHRGLGRVHPHQATPAQPDYVSGLRRSSRDPGDEIRLDLENLRRGKGTDVLGHTGSGQKRDAPCRRPCGDVLGQLGPRPSASEEAGLREEDLGPPADVGGVPGRPLRPKDGHDQLCGRVEVDPSRPCPSQSHRTGRVAVAELA